MVNLFEWLPFEGQIFVGSDTLAQNVATCYTFGAVPAENNPPPQAKPSS